MRFVCLLPVPSLPCRYRPSACCRRASLRACAVLLLRCGSGLLLLFGSFLFGFHCFSSLSLILGIKIPPFLRAVKLLSLVLICTELHKKRLFLQSLCLKSAIIANKHCKLTFGLIKPFVISLVRTMQVKIKCNQLHTGIRKPLTAVGG